MFHAPYDAASMAVQAYQKLSSRLDLRPDRALSANVVKPNYPCLEPETAIGMVPQPLAAVARTRSYCRMRQMESFFQLASWAAAQAVSLSLWQVPQALGMPS